MGKKKKKERKQGVLSSAASLRGRLAWAKRGVRAWASSSSSSSKGGAQSRAATAAGGGACCARESIVRRVSLSLRAARARRERERESMQQRQSGSGRVELLYPLDDLTARIRSYNIICVCVCICVSAMPRAFLLPPFFK